MPRRPRLIRRLLFGAAVLVVGLVATLAWMGRRSPRELLPADAALAVEVDGLSEVLERLEGTRFAAAFAAGPTFAWLQKSGAVQAIDAVRAGIGSATGFTPRRRQILDVAGRELAAAWYPASREAAGSLDAAPWLAVGKLNWWAVPIEATARVALRLGLRGGVSREEVAGCTVFTIGSGEGTVHFFGAGRLLAVANDRELIRGAARLAAGDGRALDSAESWQQVFSHLPARGELRLWARGDLIPAWVRPSSGVPIKAAGAVLAARSPVTVDVFVDAPGPTARESGRASDLPALPLAGLAPLVFHSSAGDVPQALKDLLNNRVAAVARHNGLSAPASPALGKGFALAVTAAEKGGFFPRPQGIVAFSMRDADAAQRTLRQLFPPGARTAVGRLGPSYATRESFPLAGEFELWGAAAGERLLLATQQSLIEGLAGDARAGNDRLTGVEAPGGQALDSVTTLNVTRLLPALRRYALPLAGLLRARYRAPDVSRDVELIAAVRAVAVTTSASAAGPQARITLEAGDLPAEP